MSIRTRRAVPVILAAATSLVPVGPGCSPGRATHAIGEGDCWSCHGDRYLAAKAPDHEAAHYPHDCTRCHDTASWNAISPDGHPEDGPFPLLGKHRLVGCERCHGDRFDPLDPACVACHKDDYDATTAPAHGPAGYPTTCRDCHGFDGWRPATGGGPHGPGGAFPLEGRHAEATCADCHGAVIGPLDPACVACHKDDYDATTAPAHGPAGYPTTCQDCHTASGWRPASGGPHGPTDAFPLTGGHAGRACADCHQGAYADVPRTCEGCHTDDWIAVQDPDHAKLGFPKTCDLCHTTTSWSGAGVDGYHKFPLKTGKHANFPCTNCHLPGRPWADFSCIDCHEHNQVEMASEHQGETGYAWVSKACVQCHPQGTKQEDSGAP